ncbi:MAG: hypothetical protein D6679_10255 [Candidatus Hydrogenedentota bacterium]|nr:MAG: hypothetical protein D6679_10255 [Candidatus Hydrogenedentota bacterium]
MTTLESQSLSFLALVSSKNGALRAGRVLEASAAQGLFLGTTSVPPFFTDEWSSLPYSGSWEKLGFSASRYLRFCLTHFDQIDSYVADYCRKHFLTDEEPAVLLTPHFRFSLVHAVGTEALTPLLLAEELLNRLEPERVLLETTDPPLCRFVRRIGQRRGIPVETMEEDL